MITETSRIILEVFLLCVYKFLECFALLKKIEF